MRCTFEKKDRLLKRSEFIRLSKEGKKIQNENFVAIFSNGKKKRTRLGITVTKRIGNATTRNRIKRFSREYFRLNRDFFTGCWDINIIAKRKVGELSSTNVYLSLKNIFKRISGYDKNRKNTD